MCPEESILSAYYDGEVEQNLSHIIEAHIRNCPACADKIARFQKISGFLQSSEEMYPEWNKEKIRNRVLARVEEEEMSIPFWKRRLPLPAPLAVTIGAMIFLLIGSLAFISVEKRPLEPVAGEFEPTKIEISAEDLAIIRSLLESEEVMVEVNMDIPDRDELIIIGEPQIVTEERKLQIRN
jgi:hypothetical protein